MVDLDNLEESMCNAMNCEEKDPKVMEEFLTGRDLAHTLLMIQDGEFSDESEDGEKVEFSVENFRVAENKLIYAYNNATSWSIKRVAALFLENLYGTELDAFHNNEKMAVWEELGMDAQIIDSIMSGFSQISESSTLIRSLVLDVVSKKGSETELAIRKKLGDRSCSHSVFWDDDDDEQSSIDELKENGYGTSDDVIKLKKRFIEKLHDFLKNFISEEIAGDKRLHDALWTLGHGGQREVEAKLWAMGRNFEFNNLQRYSFVFSDIMRLSDRDIQKVLREVDAQELAKALKLVDNDIKDKIFQNMSMRAATMLREDIEYMGPVRRKDVYEAQDNIAKIIMQLEEKGKIAYEKADDEMVK